jgi:hypothetical protein
MVIANMTTMPTARESATKLPERCSDASDVVSDKDSGTVHQVKMDRAEFLLNSSCRPSVFASPIDKCDPNSDSDRFVPVVPIERQKSGTAKTVFYRY